MLGPEVSTSTSKVVSCDMAKLKGQDDGHNRLTVAIYFNKHQIFCLSLHV